MIYENNRIFVGLSGGPDSVVLLHVLITLKVQLGIASIHAIHINHGLRADAIQDEAFTQELCTNWGIPLEIYHADVNNFAASHSLSIEEAGRVLRYNFFAQACSGYGDSALIATGHHQNDNAETVIMNLARGTGLRGLCGIPYKNKNIIRPLLDITRPEIEEYITTHKLNYVTDESNNGQEYARNRVRHTVIPTLENATNSQAVKNIARAISLIREDESFLEKLAEISYQDCIIPLHESTLNTLQNTPIVLNATTVSSLPKPISRRVIMLAIKHTLAHIQQNGNAYGSFKQRPITAQHIESIASLAHAKSGKEVHIPHATVRKEYSRLIFHAQPNKTDIVKSISNGIDGAPENAERALSGAFVTRGKTDFELFHYSAFFAAPLHKMLHPQKLTIPGKTSIAGIGWTIIAALQPARKLACACVSYKPLSYGMKNYKKLNLVCTKSFDYDKVMREIVFRTRNPGDKIIMQGATPFTKKLQDYFSDKKVEKHKRDAIPVLAIDSDILWILDDKKPISAKYAVSQDTKNVLYLYIIAERNAFTHDKGSHFAR